VKVYPVPSIPDIREVIAVIQQQFMKGVFNGREFRDEAALSGDIMVTIGTIHFDTHEIDTN
jgi:hypothetical protein